MAIKLANFLDINIRAVARGILRARDAAGLPILLANINERRKSAVTLQIEPLRLTLADQWNYLSEVIKSAASRAEEVTRCHTSAALQLDLAQYALTSLVDELSAVMDVGGRRRRATVHVLEVAPSRPFGEAIAA